MKSKAVKPTAKPAAPVAPAAAPTREPTAAEIAAAGIVNGMSPEAITAALARVMTSG